MVEDGTSFILGYQLVADTMMTEQGIPVALGRQEPRLWLDLQYRLAADTQGEHVMVWSSFVALTTDVDLDGELIHFDYERGKAHGYPEAHIQVTASGVHWDAVLGGRPLARLHLPVGGRRYRPTLEDVVEFLIVEKLATPLPEWQKVVQCARDEFSEIQLRAAIRNDPDTAVDQLQRMGRNMLPAPRSGDRAP